MERAYQICSRCIMDTTDPDIEFDANGVCNHCKRFDEQSLKRVIVGEDGRKRLNEIVAEVKRYGANKEYDCIIGISGGVDSSYVAYKVKNLGLRPLAVHFDSGWNSELAVNNIENIVKKLDIDLYTEVCDWEEMRDLQLSFFKASVANCDIPQDHAFMAVLYRLAAKNDIRYFISGHNIATESCMPTAWGYTSHDLTHILSIQKKFGSVKLKRYPRYNAFQKYFYYPYLKKIGALHVLNYEDYQKAKVKEFLMKELGWRDYGGKHYESRFTKFFQSYYLPVKFGYDKRRVHCSSLVLAGQMTREEALAELQDPPYRETEIQEDREFIAKKLGITVEEFIKILLLPNKTYRDYPYNTALNYFRESIYKKRFFRRICG